MKDLEKIKEFFLKDRAMTAAYEAKEEYFKPIIRKDKSFPNFLYVDIAYPAGSGVLSVGGSKTMSGQDREEGAAKALAMGNAIVKKLEAKYNIEDIEVKDLKNGKVQVFAVSDDFTKMTSSSLDEAKKETGIDMVKKRLDALGVKYEMSKTDKVRPFKVIYKPINKSDKFYDEFEDIVDLFNLKGFVKTAMNEASMLDKYKVDFFHTKANVYANIEIPSENPTFEDDIQIKGTGKTEEEAFEDLKQNYEKYKKTGISEAKEEDKVDTITMDVPLFIRMLEYSREDAAEDMDLHDVTEKAISLGKERGILQMDDYDEIIGTTEKVNEVNLKQAKLSSAEYQKAKKLKDFKASDWKWNADEDLYTKVNEGMGGQLDEPYFIEVSLRDARIAMDMFDDRYRRSNIKMYGSNVYAADTPEDIYDLYYDFQNQDIEVLDYNVDGDLDEATDYMKRRKAMDDYAVNKKDKPAKLYNPNPSGKTDYMKRREKDLSEKINEAFDKINEELCPAGKAYIKRRQAAGEKSSAYLSGRAVKVCKGQMSGRAKKKK
jgi:hypothetical protein